VNGNVFARLDRPEAEPILEIVDQTDASRDRIFNSLGGSIEIQTAKMASRMARDQAASAIQTTLDLSDKQQETDNQIRMLKRKIDAEKGMAAGYRDKTTPLVILVAALALTLAVYILLGWLLPTSLTMGIAFVVLAAGFGAAIYFSVVR
jgi:Flp pilus assembly protein TadB